MRPFTALRCGAFVFLCSLALHAQKPLPDYDARFTPGTARSSKAAVTEKQATLDGIRAAFGADPTLRVSLTANGLPRNMHRLGGVLAPAPEDFSGDATTAARAFVSRHRTLFRLTSSEVEALRPARAQMIGTATLVRLEERLAGLPVWGGGIAVTVNGAGGVVQVQTGELLGGQALDARSGLAEQEALRAGLRAANVAVDDGVALAEEEEGPVWRLFAHPRSGASPIGLRREIFPFTDRPARAVYRMFVDGVHDDSYEVLVDAESGALLYRASVVSHAGSAKYWRASPFDGGRETIEMPDEWLAPESRVTRGPNADVFLDRDLNDDADDEDGEYIVVGRAFSDDQNFDFATGEVTTAQDPRQFPAAAITNVFVHMNDAHDRFYALGFDEQAGNFQQDDPFLSSIGLGYGNDRALGAVHAGSTASFLSRPDGLSPRLRTGINTNGTLRDPSDDYDLAQSAQVIVHEYTHGVSHRLLGGPNTVSCMTGPQSAGMGEGWSDYFAISFTEDPVLGAYHESSSAESGIRRFSYEGYPYTHQDMGNEGFQVHRDGEIWAATLWDIRKSLGAAVTDQLVIDGLRLAPCRPSMADAKDAILLADELRNGGGNLSVLHEVFARHGLGYSANGVDDSPFAGSVTFNAAFDLPPAEGENRNPMVSGRMSPYADYQAAMSYTIDAVDLDGDELSYQVLEGPGGLAVSEEGEVSWYVSEYSPQRALIEVTDGRGGRVVHGFTIPILTTLTTNSPVLISAPENGDGLLTFTLPEGLEVAQVRLRGSEGDADVAIYPPESSTVFSYRLGSNETVTFREPAAGEWFLRIDTFPGFEDVSVEIATGPIPTLEPGQFIENLSDVAGSERFFQFSLADDVDTFTLTTGGEGGVELLLGEGRLPVCQATVFTNAICSYDDVSARFGAVERLTIDEAEPGRYYASLNATSAYEDVSIGLLLGDAFPDISDVVNAAVYDYWVSPGGIGTIFGSGFTEPGTEDEATAFPLPTELGGVRVELDGLAAPLYYVSETQINFQTPFETQAFGDATVVVYREGARGPFDEAFIEETAPEIFTYQGDSGLYPVIVHADGSLVTPENPATPGEVLVAYGTGIGAVTNTPMTGEAAPSDLLATAVAVSDIEVDGEAAPSLFTGLTPGFAGLAQFNFQVPADLPAGATAVSFNVTMGFFSYTSDDVTLFVAPAE